MPVERVNGLAAMGLVVLMVLGSLVLWLAVPVGWLWVASHIDNSIDASLKSYGAVAIGVPLTMLALFALLKRLDEIHQRLTGTIHEKRMAAPWRRSLSEERDLHAPTSALDIILAGTAIAAAVALVVWFFLFAGSSLPGTG
jgi:uncharacterized membrane protein YbhN (UPF0104 family)